MKGLRAVLCTCVILASASADEIVLTSGRRLSCEIIEIGETQVRVRVGSGGIITFPRSRVQEIVREEAGAYLKRMAAARVKGGALRDAVEMYRRALAKNPDDADARRGLIDALVPYARSLARAYRFGEARQALARLHEVAPGHPLVAELTTWIRQEAAASEAMYARALAALDAGQFRAALRILNGWRLRRPLDDAQTSEVLATAHLRAARDAVRAGDLRRALDHYRASRGYGERRKTTEPLYLLQPIAVLEALKVGNAEEARRLLDGFSTTYPDAAVPVLLRALRHHVLGEVEDAVKAYADAARLAEEKGDPPRGLSYDLVRKYAASTMRTAIARPPEEGVERWREVFLGSLVRDDGARHFTVYAPTERIAADVAAAADALYEKAARELLGRVPDAPKAEIVVHASPGAYNTADPAPPDTPLAGVTIDRTKTGGVCYETLDEKGGRLIRVETFDSARLVSDTLPHELVHVIQRQGLAAYRRGHWLDEGLAMLYESEAGRANRAALWRQLRGQAIPLPELLSLKSTPPDRITLFYNQAHAFATFLRGLGSSGQWTRFLDAFGKGSFEDAVRIAYDVESAGTLERMWVEHLGQ